MAPKATAPVWISCKTPMLLLNINVYQTLQKKHHNIKIIFKRDEDNYIMTEQNNRVQDLKTVLNYGTSPQKTTSSPRRSQYRRFWTRPLSRCINPERHASTRRPRRPKARRPFRATLGCEIRWYDQSKCPT